MTAATGMRAQSAEVSPKSALPATQSAQTATATDLKSAEEVVQNLFAAMKAKDREAIRALFLPDGQLVAIDKPRTGLGPSTTRVLNADGFSKLIAESKAGEFVERMEHPEVRVFGDMAIVFGRYTFHVAGKFSHCGTNSFHLVRTAEGWRIANGASTLEFTCDLRVR